MCWSVAECVDNVLESPVEGLSEVEGRIEEAVLGQRMFLDNPRASTNPSASSRLCALISSMLTWW